MSIRHPAMDASAGAGVATETRAEIAYLSQARAELLVLAGRENQRVVLVSDEVTRLTYAMQELLRDMRGCWVVRGLDGTLRNGFNGRRLETVTQVFDDAAVQQKDDVAIRYLRPGPAETVQVILSQSVRHKATATTLLGGTAEILSGALTGAAPTGWGPYEPALRSWSRQEITEVARSRAPEDTTLVVSGGTDRLVNGTIQVSRTADGLEENTQLMLGLGAPGSDQATRALESLPGAFATLAAHHMPLFGLVMARTGRQDLTIEPVLAPPPAAIGMLIGPPGVRQLDLDVTELAERFDARVVGRPRIPGLYFPLGGLTDPGWARLDEIIEHLGRERIENIVDLAGTWMESGSAR